MHELRRWLPSLFRSPARLVGGGLLALLTVLASAGLLALSGWFITAAGVTGLLLAAGVDARLGVFVPGAAIRAFALLRTGARYGERLLNHDTVLRILADIRGRLFAALVRLDAGTLARFRHADTLNRLTADIDALDNLYLRALIPPLVGALALAVVVLLLALFAPTAALAAGAVLLVTLIAGALLAALAGTRVGEGLAVGQEAVRARMLDIAGGLAELLAYGSLDGQRTALLAEDRRYLEAGNRLSRRAAAAEVGTQLGVHLAALAALAVGVALAREEVISGPVMVVLPLAVLALGEILPAIPSALVELGRTRAAARRINRQMDIEPAVQEPAVPAQPPSATPLFMDGVWFRRGAGQQPVLRDLSLEIGSGEVVAVIGPSGIGKSTLGDLAARVVDPDAGEIRLGGETLTALRRSDIVSRVGYLTQRSELFADTIAANLRIARPDASAEDLWAALAVAGLDEFVRARGDGLAAWLGESGVRLSGGQARRLALARVVLADRPLVILDEPLEGLDASTAADVRARLQHWIAEGRTALLLAHEATGVPAADRVFLLSDGHLEAVQ